MLTDDGCSIYEHRPRTCRTYDCRVFPAAGLEPDDPDGAIAQRARRWRFELPSELDEQEHAAVRAAATYVREHRPSGAVNQTQVAVRAIEVHETFLPAPFPPTAV
jgi:Fe-S-cluster containining protein